MDEYIKRDDAEKALEEHRRSQTMSMFGDRDLLEEYRNGVVGAMNVLGFVPTADVVPREALDRLTHKLECLLCYATGGKLSKSTYSLRTMESVVSDYIQETYDEACNEAKAEVAREIFEEIEKRFEYVAEHGYVGFLDALKELKEKYTKGGE